jgi:hypothetical protein
VQVPSAAIVSAHLEQLRKNEANASESGSENEKTAEQIQEEEKEGIRAEIRVISIYYGKFCTNAEHEEFCINLMNRKLEAEQALNSIEIGQVYHRVFLGDDDEASDALLVDRFAARMGAVLSRALRHVFIPPSSLFKTPYSSHVIFHVFVLKAQNVTKRFLLAC